MKIQEARNVTRDCSAHRYGPAPTGLELAALTMAAVLDEIERVVDCYPGPADADLLAECILSILNGERP